MIEHVIVPPGASIDEVVEAAIDLFARTKDGEDGGIMADAEAPTATKILVFGVNRMRVNDMIVEVESFPDRIGPILSEEPEYKNGTVKSRTLNVRKGPGTNFVILRSLPHGYKLIILEDVTNASGSPWYRVDVDGLEGFVYAPLVNLIEGD